MHMSTKGFATATGGRICVSIACNTVEEAIAAARKSEKTADVIEIRLDFISDPAVAPFTEAIATPLLFTNRPVWEGGKYSGDEEARITLLEEAVKAGAAFVDIELKAAQPLREQLLDTVRKNKRSDGSGPRVIISSHDFTGTPSAADLEQLLLRQLKSGAHVGKIVCMAHNHQDVLRVLNLQIHAEEAGFPLIAFCMGRTGMISRAATLELGGFMTYAAPDSGIATAPGQLTGSELRLITSILESHGRGVREEAKMTVSQKVK